MSIVLFLVILAVLIVSHEFGHFWAAKKAGIRVDEFGIGFPPKLFSWTRGETKYSLNLLPFGGYVKIYGEDPNEENLRDARSFTSKSRLVQAWVVVAGVVFNALLAWLLFSAAFMIGVSSSAAEAPEGAALRDAGLTVTSVLPSTPAARAGLMPGDRITEIGTFDEKLGDLSPEAASEFIAAHAGQKVAIMYARGDEARSTVVMPISGIIEERAAIGVALDTVGTLRLPVHLAFIEGATLAANLVKRTYVGIKDLLVQALQGEGSLAALTGPVGIVSLVGAASDIGFTYLLTFIGLISINLAVLNLLPLPALDGGRLLFIGIEAATRRSIPPKVMNGLNALGFILLIGLMLVVTWHDIVRLVG
ncbi:MAG: site-2 protease family protein [bacterium]|nr:site-2 protease family protein [bacterium]